LAPLRDYLKVIYKGRSIHEVYGAIEGDEREETRLELQRSTGNILLASYGTFQLGVNIPLINRILLASPSKSRVRVLQSIGRGLRNAEGKVDCEIYDFVDDFSIDGEENYTLRHAHQRQRIYKKEGFKYDHIQEQYFDRT
jgi:superfamily II DNA or RNA helicase